MTSKTEYRVRAYHRVTGHDLGYLSDDESWAGQWPRDEAQRRGRAFQKEWPEYDYELREVACTKN